MLRIILALLAVSAIAQVVDTSPRTDNKGTAFPATCVVGQRFFKTDATAGQNQYGCTNSSPATWTLMGGAGGGVSSVAGDGGGSIACTGTTSILCGVEAAWLDGRAYTPTGAVNASGASYFRYAEKLFAALPAAASSTNYIYHVTNCLTTACAAGGGTEHGLMYSNGSAWVLLGGSGSSGWPAATVAPTYQWIPMCQQGSSGGWLGGWTNVNADFDNANNDATRTFPVCTARYKAPLGGSANIAYGGQGTNIINRLDHDWDVTIDGYPTTDTNAQQFWGVQQGATIGNDACWVRGTATTSTTPMGLLCRNSGVDGTVTTMTGVFMDGTRQRFRLRRVSGTVYASANGGTEFSVTTGLPTNAFGAAPAVVLKYASGTGTVAAYIVRWGFAY